MSKTHCATIFEDEPSTTMLYKSLGTLEESPTPIGAPRFERPTAQLPASSTAPTGIRTPYPNRKGVPRRTCNESTAKANKQVNTDFEEGIGEEGQTDTDRRWKIDSVPQRNKRSRPRSTHTIPLWRKMITINPAGRGLTKDQAAEEHQIRFTNISQDADYIIIYTDGSMTGKEQEKRTGAGWVLYWKGVERRKGSEGMGQHAGVYDAEMLALLRGLQTAIEFWQTMPGENRKQSKIVLYSDSTLSVASIAKEKRELISQEFIQMAKRFLKTTRASIEVSWVPGHMRIKGNDRADELAKKATELQPAKKPPQW